MSRGPDHLQPVTARTEDQKALDQVLRFGDHISFLIQDSNVPGYVHCDAYGGDFAGLHVSQDSEDDGKHHGLHDFKNAVFQLHAQCKYKADKKLRKELNELRKKYNNSTLSLEEALNLPEASQKLELLKRLADDEAADNALEQERRARDKVVYGSVVQLWHPALRGYMRVSSHITSTLEPNNMRMELDPNTSKHSWFQIMPRFKVRAEGEPVRMGDQIVLESVKTVGQFFNVTKNSLSEGSMLPGHRECNVSVGKTALTLLPHLRPSSEAQSSRLRSGDLIQLFHKDTSAYVSAEGSRFEEESREDVHMRIREDDPRRPHRREPPTSANTFWQIEIVEHPTMGSVIEWDVPVRIKHCPSGQYLSLGSDSKCHLVSDVRDPRTIFIFTSVILEHPFVTIDSYTRIQHVATQLWLHPAPADSDEPEDIYERKWTPKHGSDELNDDLQQRMDKHAWDKAPLRYLHGIVNKQFDDAFIIQGLHNETTHCVSVVKAWMPVLKHFKERAYNARLSTQFVARVCTALETYRAFLFQFGEADRKRQKLLRNLGVIELLIETLQSLVKPYCSSGMELSDFKGHLHPERKVFVRKCYELLQTYTMGNSRKNELYLSRHLSFFHQQLGYDLGVEKMLSELIRDNNDIIGCIEERQLAIYVNLLKSARNPGFLDLFSAMCSVEEAAIGANQEKIAEMLLVKNNLLFRTQDDPNGNDVLVVVPTELNPIPLNTLSKQKSNPRYREYLAFYEKQLDLFGELCKQRCDEAIDIIKQQYLTWSQVFHCVKNENLDPSLREVYVDLMVHLFVDVGNNADILDGVSLVFNWHELNPNPYASAASDRARSITGATFDEFPALSEWIISVLNHNDGRLNANQRKYNGFLEAVMKLCCLLVEFGYYVAPSDIEALMKPLLRILQGTNDVKNASQLQQTPQVGKGGRSRSFRARVGSKAADIDLWPIDERRAKTADNTQIVKVKREALRVVDTLVNLCLTIRLQNFLYDFQQVADTNSRRQTRATSRVQKALLPTDVFSGATLTPEQLETLKLIYELDAPDEDSIPFSRLTPIIRNYIDEVIDRSNYILPGWRPADSRFRNRGDADFAEILLDLAKYDYSGLACKSLQLLNRVFSSADDLFHNIVKAQVLVVDESIDLSKRLLSDMPQIRRLGAGQIEEGEEAQDFVSRLNYLSECCKLDKEHAHSINQSLIINNGIVPILFDVLDEEDQPPSVISATFNLLEALAHNNEYVQQEFFDRLDRILDIESEELGWHDDMAKAITCVFADNERLSLALKVEHIEQMMEHLGELKGGSPDLVVTIRSIVKCEELDVPLPRNQNLVMKSLMQREEETLEVAYIDVDANPELNAKRLELLRYKGNDPATLRLQKYHANMVGLLAHCAEGFNRFIESTCMTFFSLDELIAVLNDSEIPYWIKSEYLLFLYFVYLETAVDPNITGVARLNSEPNLWRSLSNLADKVINGLYTNNDPYLSEDEERVAFDCFLPVVAYLMRNHFPQGNPQIGPHVQRMYNVVRQFASRSLERLYTVEQVEEVSSALVAMEMRGVGKPPQELKEKLSNRIQIVKEDVVLSDAYRRYRQTFARQIKLNEDLNRFARVVKTVYGGKNSISEQLPFAPKTDENEETPYCEDEEDDEYLPLGPEFQVFVDLFVKYNKASTNHRHPESLRKDDIRALIASLEASRKWSASLDAKDFDLQEVLDLRSLQILRALIHNDVKLERDYVAFQTCIAECGAVLPVASMLSVQNDDVVREALALLVILLQGGNKAAQESFLDHFLGTREETFFDDIQSRVLRSKDSKIERRNLARQLGIAEANRAELQATMSAGGTAARSVQQAIQNQMGSSDTDIELQVFNREDSRFDGMPGAATAGSNEDQSSAIADEGNIELVLRVLQYMCEGHFLPLQNYLRIQPDNVRKINLVSLTVDFLHVLVEDISPDNIELVIQTVETLVEFCQGCTDNQRCVFDSRVIDDINFIMRDPDLRLIELSGFQVEGSEVSEYDEDDDERSTETKCEQEKVAHLLLACGNLVLSMLENSDDATKETAQEIEDTLDVRRVFETLYRYGRFEQLKVEWETEEDDDDEPVTATQVTYAFFSILLRLEDFTGHPYRANSQYNKKPTANQDKIYDTMAEKAVSIEILRDNQLHKVHFLNKWKDNIRNEVKEELVWNVDRSSPSNRLHDFIARCKDIMADIQYQQRMEGWSPVTWFISRYSSLWSFLMLFVTLVINILILATWRAPHSYLDPEPEYTVSWYEDVLAVLATFHILLTVLVTTSYFLLHPPSFKHGLVSSLFGDADHIQETFPSFMSNWLCGMLDDSPGTKNSPIGLMSLYHLTLLLFSILGVFYHGYFYCFALFHVIIGNAILIRVIRAVTQNRKSLLWLAALLIIIIYVYSLISFAFLRKNFDEAEGAFCQTSFQCFITSLKLGLMSGGGLGEALPSENYSFIEPGVKTIFDLSFFIIVTLIGLNLVFGVIVDGFSELRDEAHEINEARNSECFISGLSADEFERYGNGFDEHVRREQNMWHYLAFFLHLAEKDPNEYTSHESYVSELFESDEIKFFPQNRALCLRRDDEKGLEDRVDEMKLTLDHVLHRLDKFVQDQENQRKRVQLKRQVTQAVTESESFDE